MRLAIILSDLSQQFGSTFRLLSFFRSLRQTCDLVTLDESMIDSDTLLAGEISRQRSALRVLARASLGENGSYNLGDFSAQDTMRFIIQMDPVQRTEAHDLTGVEKFAT